MPSSSSSPGTAAILAILLEAQQAGVSKITRTALMKYLYLLDLYMAEESQGKTWTGTAWRFHHFGPYAQALADEIDILSGRSLIQEFGGGGTSKDYMLYSLGEWSTAKTLSALGFSAYIRDSLARDIRSFANDLPSLLNKVYFRTEPMAKASPGDTLDFSECERLAFSSVKPIKMKPINRKAADALLAKLQGRVANRKEPAVVWEGPFDDVYFQGIAALSGDPLEEGLKGRADISIQ